MYTSSIRKKELKTGTSYQIIINLGSDELGKRRRMFFTVKGTRKEAEAFRQQKLNELQSGYTVSETKLSVGDYLTKWFESYVKGNLKPNTVDGYRVNLFSHIIPYIGKLPLKSIKPQHLNDLYATLIKSGRKDKKALGAGLSAKSVKYVHRNLHLALEHAKRNGLIMSNVSDMVVLPKVQPYHYSVYNESELSDLLKLVTNSDLFAPVYISAVLGLRRGEVLGLRWLDIDTENFKIHIQNNLTQSASSGIVLGTTKTAASNRTIEFPKGLIKVFETIKLTQSHNKHLLGSAYKDDGFVCCLNDGSPITPMSISHKFQRFIDKHNLKKIRFHDLRHTNATLMMLYNVPPKVASQRLGHSTVQITLDTYSHVIDRMDKDAAEKLDVGIFGNLEDV